MSSRSVAVVGAGISGACAASELSKYFESVLVFDQGARGPGGRASHRSVDARSHETMQDDAKSEDKLDTFEFDHGCQFFRADTPRMRDELLQEWLRNEWVAKWDARFGVINRNGEDREQEEKGDFFGLPSRSEPVYVGVGGMHHVPRKILRASSATVHRGTRVSSIKRTANGDKWEVMGKTGKEAYHDTKVSDTKASNEVTLAVVDAVLLTDISSSADSWHRASAGIPDSLRSQLPSKIRLPLFSCMIALRVPIGQQVPYDGFTVSNGSSSSDDSPLWFAARSQSKPGFSEGPNECWTLVSTPSFAVKKITETTMRDPATGAFKPQEPGYLNSVPGPQLKDAFMDVIRPYLKSDDNCPPEVVYMQAQRWGSGLPISRDLADDDNIHDVCGDTYASELRSSLVYNRGESAGPDYIANDMDRLYYAGDFCSNRNPGFEAAALSGLDAARHIIDNLK